MSLIVRAASKLLVFVTANYLSPVLKYHVVYYNNEYYYVVTDY
jgi:hypothetical protein